MTQWINIRRAHDSISAERSVNDLHETININYDGEWDDPITITIPKPRPKPIIINDLPPRFSTQCPKGSLRCEPNIPTGSAQRDCPSTRKNWKGLDKGDEKKRLYKCLPKYYPVKLRRRYRRGILMSSFPIRKLLKIAWNIGVSNPDGFDKSDMKYLGFPDEESALSFFLNGWVNTDKESICNYIWNRLYDTDQIKQC